MGLWTTLLRLIGKRDIECPRCHGAGQNSRGDWCWPCSGTGRQIIQTKDEGIS